MDRLLKTAVELQLILAVETVPYKPEVNERYADSREVADYVRTVNSPHMRICIDLNHSNLCEALPAVIANCDGQIGTIHVSDNHGHREEHLLPGMGGIDFPAAFRALQAHGYAGAVNLEVHMDGKPAVADIRKLHGWAEAMGRYLRD